MVDQGGDKVGEALNSQRFQMLTDIARDLAGDVVFPTCFDTAVQLRQELQNADVPIARIARLVSVEPLIAAKLLHLANSVHYNPSGAPVRGLPEAVTRLGVSLVRTTALAVAMNQLMRSREMAVFSELTHDLWAHSLKTAAAARILARTRTRINPDAAMLAGLGSGVFADPAALAAQWVKRGRVFDPDMRRHGIYQQRAAKYRHLTKALIPQA